MRIENPERRRRSRRDQDQPQVNNSSSAGENNSMTDSSGVIQPGRRTEGPRNLDTLVNEGIKNFLNNLRSEYQNYINELQPEFKNVLENFLQYTNFLPFINFNTIPLESPPQPTEQIALESFQAAQIINKTESEFASFFRLMLAQLLLSDPTIKSNENKRESVNKFIETELSISELQTLINLFNFPNYPGYIVNFQYLNNEIIVGYIKAYNIQNHWKDILVVTLTKRLNDKKKLEEYLKNVFKIYKGNLDILRKNLLESETLREQVRQELKNIREGEEPSEDELNIAVEQRVNEIIESLEKPGEIDIDQIMKATPEQIKELLDYFEAFNQEMEKSKKEGKKFDFKQFWANWSEKLKDVLTMMGVGVALWGVLFAFFLPVYFVEKIKKEIKI